MNMVKPALNKNGMSLIEVLIAISIMGILSYGMIDMVTSQNKAVKTAQNSIDINEVYNSIQRYMLDSNTCKSTMGGITILPGEEKPIADIKKTLPATGSTILLSTAPPQNTVGNIKVSALSIKRLASDDIELIVKLNKVVGGNSYGGDAFQRSVKLSVQYEAAPNNNTIKNCYSQLETAVETARKETCEDIYGVGAWDATLKKCVKPVSASGKPIYLNPINGQLQLSVPPSYHDVPVSCSNCGSNCTPGCPGGGYGLISNNCRMSGNCGFRRWRDCNGVCRKSFPAFVPEGYLIPNN